MINYNDMFSYTIYEDNKRNPYIKIKCKDWKNKTIEVDFHAYLFGLLHALKIKRQEKKRQAIGIITGDVGDGKSTLAKGLSALDGLMNGTTFGIEDIAWSVEDIVKLIDSTENNKKPILADEAINIGGNKGIALTNLGGKLKNGLVVKRLKGNIYLFLADSLKEIPEKIVEMADFYVNVKSFMLNNGYFDCWTNQEKIKLLYILFKEEKKKWSDSSVRKVYPDCKGKFENYENIFIDEEAYVNEKIERTRQLDDEEHRPKSYEHRDRLVKYLYEEVGLTQTKIAAICGVTHGTIGNILKKN